MTGRTCNWTWLYCLFTRSHQDSVYSLSCSIAVGRYNYINYSVRSGCIFNSIQGWIPCVLDLVSSFWVAAEVPKLPFLDWRVMAFLVVCSSPCICLVSELLPYFEVCISQALFMGGESIYLWLVSIFCSKEQVGRQSRVS